MEKRLKEHYEAQNVPNILELGGYEESYRTGYPDGRRVGGTRRNAGDGRIE